MTQTAVVALGIVLIAMVVYLATEHTGLRGQLHFYAQGANVGDATGVDIRLATPTAADSRGLSIAAAEAADPSRPGFERATYTLTMRDHSEVFYADGAAVGSATGVDIESADLSRLTVAAVEAADPARTGERRVTYTLTPIDVADPQHFYAQGVNVGDATGVDVQSANTTLLTVAAVEAADPARTGFERVTYTLTPHDQSATYRLNGASPVTATAGHSLDFLTPGACIDGALGGDGSGGARLTLQYVCGTVGELEERVGTIAGSLLLSSNGVRQNDGSGRQIGARQRVNFVTGPVQTASTATTEIFRTSANNLGVRTGGAYLIVAELRIWMEEPGTYAIDPVHETPRSATGRGTCPPGSQHIPVSAAAAVAPSPLATSWPAWDTRRFQTPPWPAGEPYCEGPPDPTASPPTTADETPNKATDTARISDSVTGIVDTWSSTLVGELRIQTINGDILIDQDILIGVDTRALDMPIKRWYALTTGLVSGDELMASLELRDFTMNGFASQSQVALSIVRLRP